MQLQIEAEDQESGSCEMEFEGEHRWTARDRTVLNVNDNMRVEIEEELEFLLGPEDSESGFEADLEVREEENGWHDL